MLFSRVRQNNQLFSSLSSNFQPYGSKYSFVVFYREFTKLATDLSFFVLVASALATVGPGAPSPLTTACAPPHFGHSECFFGASRNDKTTGNDGKRNNNFQTSFSFKVFLVVCKITGNQLLCINVTQ